MARHGTTRLEAREREWERRQERMTITEARVRGMLARRAAAPLKGKADQKPCDIGLFSDDAKQIDLMDLVRK